MKVIPASTPLFGVIPAKAGTQRLLAGSKTLGYSRHPWRSPFGPPAAFAFAVLQTQSGSPLRGVRNDEG